MNAGTQIGDDEGADVHKKPFLAPGLWEKAAQGARQAPELPFRAVRRGLAQARQALVQGPEGFIKGFQRLAVFRRTEGRGMPFADVAEAPFAEVFPLGGVLPEPVQGLCQLFGLEIVLQHDHRAFGQFGKRAVLVGDGRDTIGQGGEDGGGRLAPGGRPQLDGHVAYLHVGFKIFL